MKNIIEFAVGKGEGGGGGCADVALPVRSWTEELAAAPGCRGLARLLTYLSIQPGMGGGNRREAGGIEV